MNGRSSSARRLLIVSNRLPFTAVKIDGEYDLVPSSGGLVSGLGAYLESLGVDTVDAAGRLDYVWVGWPGATIADGHKARLEALALHEHHAFPVFLSEDEMDKFYYGFCNETIWPLFHYFPSFAVYDEEYWLNYKQVNEAFCDAVMEVIRPDDIVWIHDYQLMLLPRLIKEKMPDTPIGFFLHIPFPDYEVYRLLPHKWAAEILQGILGADLVGFHTHDYTQYFLRSVLRVLGHEHNLGQLIVNDRMTMAQTFPMGIDYDKFCYALQDSNVAAEKNQLRESLRKVKMVLSIDRLDYTKGVINRLLGYELFLKQHPEWRGRVALGLVVVPSRTSVGKYQETKEQIEELVGRINGTFGNLDWTPVLYQYKSLPFESLVAYYGASDAALVTPLRDGMNLVAKEYIATRDDGMGVLILSEMAGASKELNETILINPNSREEIADAIKEALEMPAEEQVRRNRVMQGRLKRYNVVLWAQDFIAALLEAQEDQRRFKARLLSPKVEEQLLADFDHAKRRLILLDYDGTLIPFFNDPQEAKPSAELLKVIERLAGDTRNEVVLISGRERHSLEEWFGGLGIGMVAEHGVWTWSGREDGWQMTQPLSSDWKPSVRPVLETYKHRLPGSFLEEKDYSIAWHYRAADPDAGPMMAKELLDHLVNYTANIDVQVLQGNKVIEIKSAGVNKGSTGLRWISKSEPDFILAVGDDWTDEHLFTVLPESAYSVRVGLVQSYARFNVRTYQDVLQLIEKLARHSEGVGVQG